MAITVLRGPAGAGKSQSPVLRETLDEGGVVIDMTTLFAALRALERDDDGRYPERTAADDKALSLTRLLKAAAVRHAVELGIDAVFTSSSPDASVLANVARWSGGAQPRVVTVDPGEAKIRERLAYGKSVSPECEKTIRRWYGR